jgi:hypothetical protein
MLVFYIKDKPIMLLLFNLEEKQALLLMLNQIVQIYDNLFKFCGQAMKSKDKAVGAPARYAWVTFQALDCMEGYLKEQF